jgi:DNA-binding transcriptional LysR family regulator
MDPQRLGLVSPRLHYFQLVARLGSIREAARVLNIAPSSISRAITQFEEELGAPLFDRAGGRLKLTSAGELMLYHARSSGTELARAVKEIGELKGLRRGSFAIAVVESVARGLMPDVLATFWQRHPDIAVDVRIADSQHAFEAVAEGDCEIGVAFDTRTPRRTERLAGAEIGIGALVRPDHRLSRQPSLRLYELAGERVLLSDRSLTLGLSVEEALEGSVVGFLKRTRTNSIELMVDLALRGLGVALQTRVGVERELARGDLIFVPVRDPRLKPRKLVLVTGRKAEISEAALALATLFVQRIEAMDERESG